MSADVYPSAEDCHFCSSVSCWICLGLVACLSECMCVLMWVCVCAHGRMLYGRWLQSLGLACTYAYMSVHVCLHVPCAHCVCMCLHVYMHRVYVCTLGWGLHLCPGSPPVPGASDSSAQVPPSFLHSQSPWASLRMSHRLQRATRSPSTLPCILSIFLWRSHNSHCFPKGAYNQTPNRYKTTALETHRL